MAEPVPPAPSPGRSGPTEPVEPEGPADDAPAPAAGAAAPHRTTERTMAAAAAAAAATAAVASLPPVTAPIPVPGRRARPAPGNPYAPGGPEAAITGPLPAAASLFTPPAPHRGLRHHPPAQHDGADAAPAARHTAPAPWAQPVTHEAPAANDATPSPDGAARPLDPARSAPPAEPRAPGRTSRRGTVAAAAIAVVALATTVVVVVERWPFHDRDSGVSLSANPTVAGPSAAPSTAPSAVPVPPTRQPTTPAAARPVRPKLGVFRGTSRSEVRAFERWSGAEVDYVMDYSARDTWREIADPQYMLDEWRGTGYRPVYAVALLPTEEAASLADGARGDYDRYFRQLARNLVRAGQADAILRVGWEFNVSVSTWRAGDPAVFKTYWRRVVAAMRSVEGQRFEFDWNVNAGNIQVDAARYWPGGDVVDYVGVDVYDLGWEPGTYPYPEPCAADCRLAHQRAAWDEILGGPRGLAFWSDFAKAHGKPMSLPEWGLWRRDDGHGGGDNPYFIERMHAFLTDPANNVAYQGYFEANEPGLGDYHRLKTMTAAGATFRRLFR